MRVGMRGRVSGFDDEIFNDGVRLIFTLAFFILDDATLKIEDFLTDGIGKEAHPIAFSEERVIESGDRHIFEVVGAVFAGGSVKIRGADALHGFNVASGKMLAAAEHQVLKKMRETGFAKAFVFGTHVIPDVQRDDGVLRSS